MTYLELLTQDYFVIFLIYHISNVKCKFIKFVNNAIKSSNNKVNFVAELCINSTLSAAGCNISNILYEYKISMFDIMYGNNMCCLMNKSDTKIKYKM